MIRVSVLYAGGEDVTFDHAYYEQTHLPMVTELLGDVLRGITVDRGVAGGAPGAPPTYVAMAHLLFDSLEDFQGAAGPLREGLGADAPNYTNAKASVQISEVVR